MLTVISQTEGEHPNPCDRWLKLITMGRVGYEWAGCCCSPIERDYQMKMGEHWRSIDSCPYCRRPINEAGKLTLSLKLEEVENHG